jgi:hypothetical protein
LPALIARSEETRTASTLDAIVEGSIIFHTREADHPLEPGRQLHLAAGTDHAATVGPLGVTCREFHSS